MNTHPIVERELGAAARRTATYRSRLLAPVFLGGLGVAKPLLMATPVSAALAGADLFHTLSLLTVAFCVLQGAHQTSDCLSQERREGTLGLLFLTDLKAPDIILGKLLSTSLTSLYALFAMLPILSWSLFLGGVTLGEIGRVGLAVVNLLLFSLSAGIWVSARSRSANRAMSGTLFLVLAILAAPLLPGGNWLSAFSPACAFLNASNAQYAAHAFAYWTSLMLAPALSWAFLLNAAAIISRFRDDDGAVIDASAKSVKSSGGRERRAKLRTRLLGRNPICWLANRHRVSPALVWLLALGGGLGIWCLTAFYHAAGTSRISLLMPSTGLLLLLSVIGLHGILKILLASQACRCFAEARHNATLELLLCAPLQVMDILQGQILALRRTFLLPLLVLCAFEMCALYGIIYANFSPMTTAYQRQEFRNAVIFGEGALLFFVLIDFQAVAWAGMWFGLCSRNGSRATFKTIFFVILLPHLVLILSWLGVALFPAWPIATLVWSRLRLQEHFRVLAGNRLTATGEANGWLPFEIPEIPQDAPIPLERAA